MSTHFLLRCIDDSSGLGLSRVLIRAGTRGEFEYSRFGEFESDANGECVIALPGGPLPTLLLTAFRNGYVPRHVRFAVDHGDDLPEAYTVALERAIRIGGFVRTETGQPIAGAKVTLQAGPRGYGPAAREWVALERDRFAVETDGNGAWSCHFAPDDLSDITVHVDHPDYAGTHAVVERCNSLFDTQVLTRNDLLNGSVVIQLSPGFPVFGRITGPRAEPLANARVTFTPVCFGSRQSVHSGPDGAFKVQHCPRVVLRRSGIAERDWDRFRTENRWKSKLVVEADGLAPALCRFSLEDPPPELHIRMTEAVPAKGRVLNSEGESLSGVRVVLQWQPEGEAAARQGVTHFWRTQTNDRGEFAWDSAPGGPLQIFCSEPGFMTLRREFPGERSGREEIAFTLERADRLTCALLDADSHQSIAVFRVHLLDANSLEFAPGTGSREVFFGKDGQFSFELRNSEICAVRVEADGYECQIAKLGAEARAGELNFALRKQKLLKGTVISPDGQPAAGAQVRLVHGPHPVPLDGPGFTWLPGGSAILQSDAQGSFAIPRPSPSELGMTRRTASAASEGAPVEPCVLAAHAFGFGSATESELSATGALRLYPWGRIAGELRSSASRTGRIVRLTSVHGADSPVRIHLHREVQTDQAGRFAFEHLPAGNYRLERVFVYREARASLHLRDIAVKPGAAEQLVLGRSGRLVIGRFQVEPEQRIDWSRNLATLRRKRQSSFTGVVCTRTVEIRDVHGGLRERQFLDGTEEDNLSLYPVLVAKDGSFQIEDVEPGEYFLSFTPAAEESGTRTTSVRGKGVHAVVITAADAGSDPEFDLGTILVTTR